ncbi:MAG: ribose-phosphate diphosphokinase [Chloroflexi bacterium]|nr:ribose-phosphate diphosphokinase [Chloroflexota bacterium]
MQTNSSIYGTLAVLSGSGNPALAQVIAAELGIELRPVNITVFSNENIFMQLEESVRSQDVFIIQPTCSPVNYNIMELLIMIDTVKRASAGRITAVVPFYSYARSDKKDQPRVPITARLIADLICAAGADRFMVVDLHAGQIQGFFNIPGDEITAFPLICRYLLLKQIPNLVVVAADLGFAKKARNIAEILHAPVAFIEKRRRGTSTECLSVIGDVAGMNAVIVDDEVDRGGTVAGAARILREAGALDVYAAFVHATFSEGAVQRLVEANFKEIICTDTEPIPPVKTLPNMTVISVGPMIAQVIHAVHTGLSVGETLTQYASTY